MENRTWWWIGGGAVVLVIILFFVFGGQPDEPDYDIERSGVQRVVVDERDATCYFTEVLLDCQWDS